MLKHTVSKTAEMPPTQDFNSRSDTFVMDARPTHGANIGVTEAPAVALKTIWVFSNYRHIRTLKI